MTPTFSIVMATYKRGRHIIPSVKSVLGQDFEDYELIVVGDGREPEAAASLRPYLSERVKWMNLPERSGSQAGPNNAAIGQARGRYVAYLGHDDLWMPDHLAALHRTFARYPDASFAVSGCICYGPPGSGHHLVTGLFDTDDAKFAYFFPPSSFAHPVDTTARIGPWRMPETIKRPIDADLLLRAAEEGMRFVSTGRITVHKFASGGRYLSYARHDSEEQELIARLMTGRDFPSFVGDVVARSRELGTFGLKYPDFTAAPEGELHRQIGIARGILRPPLLPLDGPAIMPQGDDNRALDWGRLASEGNRRLRWSGPNPRPKILIPYTARGKTRLRFVVRDASDDGVIEKTRLVINGVSAPSRILCHDKHRRRAVLECKLRLPAHNHTIVELDLTGGAPLEAVVRSITGRPERIALAEIGLRPGRDPPRGLAGFARRVFRRLNPVSRHNLTDAA